LDGERQGFVGADGAFFNRNKYASIFMDILADSIWKYMKDVKNNVFLVNWSGR